MTLENALITIAGLLWFLAIAQGTASLAEGFSFHRFVRRAVRQPRAVGHPPKSAVILPCCGVDERLHKTVEHLGRQNHPDYEILFTFESAEDPAHEAVREWTRDWIKPRHRLVVAGLADRRAQKIQNLLAAVAEVSADREALVFLDSDAEPHPDWLASLVAPLADPGVGAATGYRWYSARGGLANGVRSCWNAATVTLLHDERRNFCWGGSTAVRRETFARLKVAKYWDRALSDDYQMTRAVHEAGLAIRFVPQALIPSHDKTTLRGFWEFARRQLIITRVCGPEIWRSGFILCINFIIGGSAALGLFLAAAMGWTTNPAWMWAGLAGWLAIMLLASVKALVRQLAIRQVLGPPAVTWRDFLWDVCGVNLSGILHLSLMLSSLGTRQFAWRHTIYEMISPDETRVVGRINRSANGDLRSAPGAPPPAAAKPLPVVGLAKAKR